ncbi:hypothetical protein ACFQZE_21335 [Paenibacillus sp. GCM10027627]|uniref:hypothetical protein n=1 Tax=unclassified Paenibacillus TaxID=185978 RepID=UPI003626E845
MLYKVITKLHFLKISEKLNKGKSLHRAVRLSNSNQLLRREFDIPFFLVMIGQLERLELDDSSYLYAIGEIQDKLDDQRIRIDFLTPFINVALVFSTALWLVKDNSVSSEYSFLYVEHENGPSTTSNGRYGSYFCNAKAESETVEFNQLELEQAMEFFKCLVVDDSLSRDTQEAYARLNGGAPRLERSLYFLQAARAQNHLPTRITLYCTVLESLLSTDTTEITHKIAERAAWLLESEVDKRILIYKKIKTAYSIRSATIHGSALRKAFKTNEVLQKISIETDNLLRRLLVEIITDDSLKHTFQEMNQEELNDWFIRLSFQN